MKDVVLLNLLDLTNSLNRHLSYQAYIHTYIHVIASGFFNGDYESGTKDLGMQAQKIISTIPPTLRFMGLEPKTSSAPFGCRH